MITLDPSSAANAQATLTATYGATGMVFTAPAVAPPLAASPRLNPPAGSPVTGGQDITDGYERCTANISARSAAGAWYVMTAGHCFPAGDTASQNNSDSNLLAYTSSKSIGSVGATPYGPGRSTNCDCEALGPIAASQVSRQAFVNGEKTYTFNNVANSRATTRAARRPARTASPSTPRTTALSAARLTTPASG